VIIFCPVPAFDMSLLDPIPVDRLTAARVSPSSFGVPGSSSSSAAAAAAAATSGGYASPLSVPSSAQIPPDALNSAAAAAAAAAAVGASVVNTLRDRIILVKRTTSLESLTSTYECVLCRVCEPWFVLCVGVSMNLCRCCIYIYIYVCVYVCVNVCMCVQSVVVSLPVCSCMYTYLLFVYFPLSFFFRNTHTLFPSLFSSVLSSALC
jgi:hypothetical protein